ncbi:cytochrome P450 [Brevibacillus fortis]|uniref:cytochrome P450 n=1 Tax=Brevibacillus fortis TaxID=2126352 RepID=UPI002E1B451E|nr:cytochrome P450 [Brevibacillus fortis]
MNRRLIEEELSVYTVDPLAFLTEKARQTDVIRLHQKSGKSMYFLLHPDDIKEVLVTQHHLFVKGRGARLVKIMLLGDGIITTDGDQHRKARTMMNPHFRASDIASYVKIMVRETNAMLDHWSNGGMININHEMARLVLRITNRSLFGYEIEQDIEPFINGIWKISELMRHQNTPSLSVKNPRNIIRELDKIVYGMMEKYRSNPKQSGHTLLATLMESDMSNEAIRDQIMSMTAASFETTASALTWTLYLLCQHPECIENIVQEAKTYECGDRSPDIHTLNGLMYTSAVIKESLRLYPPSWALTRETTEDVNIHGVMYPQASDIYIPQYILHRDERYFEKPNQFLPERFLPGSPAPSPYVYFPFGLGPRSCIGMNFAIMEISTVLSLLLSRFTLHIPEDQPPLTPQIGFSMTPSNLYVQAKRQHPIFV